MSTTSLSYRPLFILRDLAAASLGKASTIIGLWRYVLINSADCEVGLADYTAFERMLRKSNCLATCTQPCIP